MKTLQQQARDITKKPKYEESDYFLRRYYTEEHLRINTVSGMALTIDSLIQLANDSAYASGESLNWIWSPDDDEFLLAEHVAALIRSEVTRLGIRGLEFSVESAGVKESIRMWKVSVSVSEIQGEIVVFDVRGVKSLMRQIHSAFLSEV